MRTNVIQIKENATKLNYEDEYSIAVNDEEENVTTDTKVPSSEKTDDKHKGEKEVIAKKRKSVKVKK